jgi:shikimate kinase
VVPPSPSSAPGARRSAPEPSLQRVVLLGFMCSGKSTVGEALARRLNWNFLDFDVEIERRENATVSAIIDAHGEEYFRAAEAALTEEVSRERGLVLSPGGGWITRPELLEAIRPGTLSVWLSVSVEETVRRLRSDAIDRPFKDHPEPQELIAAMLQEREPLYRLADLRIPAEIRSPEEIAYEIEHVVRARTAPSLAV